MAGSGIMLLERLLNSASMQLHHILHVPQGKAQEHFSCHLLSKQ